ncbi:MAG: hypothetical protein AB1485_04630 [Candidatus Thermoplasmatota archaeon]
MIASKYHKMSFRKKRWLVLITAICCATVLIGVAYYCILTTKQKPYGEGVAPCLMTLVKRYHNDSANLIVWEVFLVGQFKGCNWSNVNAFMWDIDGNIVDGTIIFSKGKKGNIEIGDLIVVLAPYDGVFSFRLYLVDSGRTMTDVRAHY